MKARTLLVGIMVLFSTMTIQAQTSLAGRVYHHPNIMAELMDELMKDSGKKLEETKKEALADFEKKKGRKPNADEIKKINEQVKEAQAMLEAIRKGMKTAVTVEFKSDKDVVMKADMKISDAALKAAGVGWAKRKAMLAALAIAPTTQKAKYTVKGNTIYMIDGEERDTMQLSADGKYLSGKMDEKTSFKLPRTK